MKKMFLLPVIGLALCSWTLFVQQSDDLDDYIPTALKTTTMLVEKFEQQDPKKFPPADVTGGNYMWPRESDRKSKSYDSLVKSNNWEHPLVKNTNKDLEKNNQKLVEALKGYKYKYEVITRAQLKDTAAKYANTDEYRYVLRRTPFQRVIEGPSGTVYLTYGYYFYDRVDRKNMKLIDSYSPNSHIQTLKKVVTRLNEAIEEQSKVPQPVAVPAVPAEEQKKQP